MPNFRQISTWRNAQDTKAPNAHTVMTCHRPPAFIGANRSPFEMAGGAILICHMFQVGPDAAPHRIITVPSVAKKTVVIPKKPT